MIRKRTIDRSTYRHKKSIIWQKCTSLRALKQIHASMLVGGFNSDVSSLREFIFAAAVSISSTIDYAHQVFDQITQPDIFMWNSIIRGSASSGNPSNAVYMYGRMERNEISPDRFTFPCLFKAVSKLSWVGMGLGFHGKVVKLGFDSNSYVRNALINFHSNIGDLIYARKLFDDGDGSAKSDAVAWSAMIAGFGKRGKLDIARKMFDEMPQRDLVSWNVMITAYAKRGEMEKARRLFEGAPARDAVTWNVIVAGYVSSGEFSSAIKAFDEMRISCEIPDEVTMISVLSAIAELRDLELGLKVHRGIKFSGDPSILLGNALINMYAKCGSIQNARQMFDKMPRKDATTWNSVMNGLAYNGHAEEVLSLFEAMLELKSIRPNEITLVAVLVACSHTGKVEQGRRYFDLMRTKYRIKPNVKHCGCMVDMLGRAGLLDEAFEFIKGMEVEPNAVVWRALLGACKVHGNVELGWVASEALLGMKTGSESGDFVLLSNIYASRGEWVGAERVRKSMDDRGVLKEAGFSLIEIEADDNNHLHRHHSINTEQSPFR